MYDYVYSEVYVHEQIGEENKLKKNNTFQVYWVGPLAGGVCAGLLYDLLYAGNASGAKFWGYFTLNYDEQIYERKDKRLSECFEEETRQLRSRMNAQ